MLNDDVDIPQSTLDNTRDYITQSYSTPCGVFKHDIPEWLYALQRANGLGIGDVEYAREEDEQEIPF